MAEENKTTTQAAALPFRRTLRDKFESSKTHARKAAEDLKIRRGRGGG